MKIPPQSERNTLLPASKDGEATLFWIKDGQEEEKLLRFQCVAQHPQSGAWTEVELAVFKRSVHQVEAFMNALCPELVVSGGNLNPADLIGRPFLGTVLVRSDPMRDRETREIIPGRFFDPKNVIDQIYPPPAGTLPRQFQQRQQAQRGPAPQRGPQSYAPPQGHPQAPQPPRGPVPTQQSYAPQPNQQQFQYAPPPGAGPGEDADLPF